MKFPQNLYDITNFPAISPNFFQRLLAKLRSGEFEAGGVGGGQERGCTTGAIGAGKLRGAGDFFSQDLQISHVLPRKFGEFRENHADPSHPNMTRNSLPHLGL